MYYDYLADVLCKVSRRFKRLATDSSLWSAKWGVVITAGGDPRKAEFVVQECLNSGTRSFHMVGSLHDLYPILTSPRYAEYINPTTRLPHLKLMVKGDKYFCAGDLCWIDEDEVEKA